MINIVRVDPSNDDAKNYFNVLNFQCDPREYIYRADPDDDVDDTLQSRTDARGPVKSGSDASIGGARPYHYFRE